MMNRFLSLFFVAASCLTAVGQVPDYLVSSNPVMYFDFDGNAIEGVNGDEPLLPSGDIEYVESAERHVLELNGSGAHLYHPDAGFPSFQTVSMCIEVRLDEFGSGLSGNLVPILSKWESTGTQNNEWNVFETDGQIWLWWTESSNPGRAISFSHNWTAGEWHTICFEVGARAALWIDGEFVEEKIRDEFGSSNRLFRLGDWNNFLNPSYRTFDGAIDRLAIWSSLLSDNTSQAFHLGEAIAPGCTNPEACNYDNEANQEDGSCVACDVATGFCGEGTAWDPETQTCIVANPADINLDGCVQLNDLLDLLGAYGGCEAEASPWLCGDPLDYQGYDYETVQIGEQCWFAENARYLPFVSPSDLGWEDDGGAHAYVAGYEGTSVEEAMTQSEYEEYGTLYNFVSVQESLMCPQGWHVPSLSEWDVLKGSIGISSAYKLKSAPPVWDGTNELGFNAIRVPVRTSNGSFTDYSKADFWTSTSIEESDNAWGQELNTGDDTFTDDPNGKGSGNPVRCLKDTE